MSHTIRARMDKRDTQTQKVRYERRVHVELKHGGG